MKLEAWFVGKHAAAWDAAIMFFEKRIQRYQTFNIHYLPECKHIKGVYDEVIKKREADSVLRKLNTTDYLVLLDERGPQYTTTAFARRLQYWQHQRIKKLVLLAGGAYGYDTSVYDRKNEMISLSKMTFSHEVIRVMMLEQLYRALSVLHGDPYHHI